MKHPPGYIAIITTIILAAVVILVAVSNANRIRSQTQVLIGQEQRAQSRALADSCGEIALAKLGPNNSYAGAETVNLGGLSCDVVSVIHAGANYTIRAHGRSGDSNTEVEIIVTSLDPMAISSWKAVL